MKRMGGLSDGARAALEARGIKPALAERRGVVSASPGRGDVREWIACPHRDEEGSPTHWQFRTLTGAKDFQTSTGTSDHRTFFNAEVLRDPALAAQKIIITEGQLDALALEGIGYPRVVSVPDGAPAGPTEGKRKYEYIERYRAELEACQEVILAVDDDEKGHALLRDLVVRIGPERCKWATYGGCKDVDELLIAAGGSAVTSAIESAKWVNLDGLYHNIDDVPPLPEAEILTFGCGGLDRLWRIQRGRLTVLVGVPSHGKTALLNDVMTALVNRHGVVVCFASFEQYPRPEHKAALRRCYLRMDPSGVSPSRLDEADQWIRDHFLFMVPSRDEPPDVEWLLQRAKIATLRHNAAVLVLDPWNELAHEGRPADIPIHEYVSIMLRKVRRFAQEYQMAVIIAVHPAKMQRDKDGKANIPTGYDCADSAAWVNRADTGLTIYRKNADRTLIRNWKSRKQPELGCPGDEIFSFQPPGGRFVWVPGGDT